MCFTLYISQVAAMGVSYLHCRPILSMFDICQSTMCEIGSEKQNLMENRKSRLRDHCWDFALGFCVWCVSHYFRIEFRHWNRRSERVLQVHAACFSVSRISATFWTGVALNNFLSNTQVSSQVAQAWSQITVYWLDFLFTANLIEMREKILYWGFNCKPERLFLRWNKFEPWKKYFGAWFGLTPRLV